MVSAAGFENSNNSLLSGTIAPTFVGRGRTLVNAALVAGIGRPWPTQPAAVPEVPAAVVTLNAPVRVPTSRPTMVSGRTSCMNSPALPGAARADALTVESGAVMAF